MKKLRPILANCILMMATFLIVIVLLEILLRLAPSFFNAYPVPRDYMPAIFQKDPDITWTVKPNSIAPHKHIAQDFSVTVNTNEFGFRKIPFSPEKQNALVLGDSFAFGFGVEDQETFPAYLAHHVPGYNIFNAGYTSGMSLDTQYRYLKKHHRHLRPSLVIVQFFAGNDFSDIQSNRWTEDGRGLPDRIITPYYVDAHSRLSRKHGGLPVKVASLLRTNSYFFNFLWNRLHLNKYTNKLQPVRKATIEKTRHIINELHIMSLENNFKLFFVFVPYLREDKAAYAEYYSAERELYPVLRSNGIPFTSLKSLQTHPLSTLYFKHDGHFTKYGNAIIAKEIARLIQDADYRE